MHPIVFRIGDYPIHAYGVMVALAFLVGLTQCLYLARKRGMEENTVSDLMLWVMISGIIGARLGHVISEYDEYIRNPVSILYIHRGGLIFYGGVIGGVAGVALFAWIRRQSLLRLGDLVLVAVPVGHALGRIGCFLNGCCFGKWTDSFTGVRFPIASPAGWAQYYADRIANDHIHWVFRMSRNDDELRNGLQAVVDKGLAVKSDLLTAPVHPVQLYESALDIVLYLVLLRLFLAKKRDGVVSAVFMIGYGVIRLGTEMLRGDARQSFGLFTVAQAISMAAILTGLIFFLVDHVRQRQKNPGCANA